MNHLPGPTTDFRRDLTHVETIAVTTLGDRIRMRRQETDLNPGDKLVWIEVRYDDIPDMTALALRQSMEKLANLGWIVKLHERRISYWTTVPTIPEEREEINEKYIELFWIALAR
jgi:hypothetical protein